MDVGTRCKKHVYAILKHLITNTFTSLLNKVKIPCGRKHRSDRITCAIVSVIIIFSGWRNTKTSRTVGKNYSRNTIARNTVDYSGRAWNTGIGVADTIKTLGSTTDNKCTFLFWSHSSHHFRNIILTKLWHIAIILWSRSNHSRGNQCN